jgi:hypothetical protein
MRSNVTPAFTAAFLLSSYTRVWTLTVFDKCACVHC